MNKTESHAGHKLGFKTPPIIEAVIAVTIPELPESVVESLRDAKGELSLMGFIVQLPKTKHDFQIKVEEGISSFEASDQPIGFQYIQGDRSFAVQFLRTGFIFSQLGNYSSWEEFTDFAQKVWSVYVKIVGLVELSSFNVRYINKLYVPDGQPWQYFIKIYPYIPEEVPQQVAEYFMRIVMPIASPQGRLSHQQAILPPEKEGFFTMLFDNDFQFSAIGVPLSALWKRINETREIKNDYFDKFLTDLMKGTFNA
jgi:uncharacterized protein (TIGR04255 family)